MANRNLENQTELVKFQGDDLPAYRETVDEKEIVRVNVRAVCEALGIKSNHQLERIREDPILIEGLARSVKRTGDGNRESFFLDVECLPLWLAQIHLGRVKEEVREKLVTYRREAKTVLYEYFLGKGFAINEYRANMQLLLEETQQLKQKRLELIPVLLPYLEKDPQVDRRYITRIARLAIDEAMGLRESEPQEVSLMDFLNTKGLKILDSSDTKLLSYDKTVARFYRKIRGREPLKRSKILKTGEFMVNYYTTEDMDVLEEAYQEWSKKHLQ